nr:PP2C family protein-serine/threonine phosphatase [Lachnospiraceae bacterium]
FVAAFITNIFISRRIVKLTKAAIAYTECEDKVHNKGFFKDVNIKSNDEVGALCRVMVSMEAQINDYIENITKITAEKQRISTELDVAANIQKSMLPSVFPPFPEYDSFDIRASMTPAKEVGGDFYDFFLVDEDHLGLVIADVSGKGVPASLVMVIAKTLINNQTMTGGSPDEILEKVNNILCANNYQMMFVTVWLGIMEISTGKIIASNAGHEYPIIKGAEGNYEIIRDKHGLALGCMENMKYTEYEFVLEEGGCLYLYTDGVPEATRSDDVQFGMDRTLETLNTDVNADPEKVIKNMVDTVNTFVDGAPPFDDMTMLVIERKRKK